MRTSIIFVFFLLLGQNAGANATDDLRLAIYSRNYTECRVAIAKGGNVNAYTRDGKTLLWHATSRGNENIVRLLLEKGADSAKVARHSVRPKEVSLPRSRSHLHGLLSRMHSNPHSKSFAHRTPPQEKIKNEGDGSLATSRPISNKQLPIHLAIERQNIPMIETLLKYGSIKQIASHDDGGNNIIHLACSSKNRKVFEAILSAARLNSNSDIHALLTKAVNTPNHAGLFPIHLVALRGHEAFYMFDSLLKIGAFIDAIASDGLNRSAIEIAEIFMKIAQQKLNQTMELSYKTLMLYLAVKGANISRLKHLNPALHDIVEQKRALDNVLLRNIFEDISVQKPMANPKEARPLHRNRNTHDRRKISNSENDQDGDVTECSYDIEIYPERSEEESSHIFTTEHN